MNFIQKLFQQYPVTTIVTACVLLLISILLPVFLTIYRRQRLLKSGLSATAKILNHKTSMLKLGKHAGSEFMQGVWLELMVNPNAADSYEVKSRSVIHVSDFARIQPGMLVKVRVDPKNKQNVMIEQWHPD